MISPKAHGRSFVISNRWDEKSNVGYMTFECKTCSHSWEWKAVYEQKPIKGKPYSKAAWSMFSRYWGKQAGGVKTKCPKCGSGGS